jgi:hypothetical protein
VINPQSLRSSNDGSWPNYAGHSNPDIQKIAFTGSTQIGKLVAKNSLDTMKRLTLELGASRQTSSWTTPISPRRSRWPSTPATE